MLREFVCRGALLRWREYGSGPPMVLVHGLSGSGLWWSRNLPALSAHYRVYVLELSGYGSACGRPSLGVQASAGLICAWLQAQHISGAVLVGHSMGGQIATLVASRCPERLRALVLASSTGLLKASLGWEMLQLPRALITGRADFVPTIAFDALRAGPCNLLYSARSLLGHSTRDLLPNISVPTLVVWGGRDALVPPALGRALARAVPGAQYTEFPHAGHVVMVDAAGPFNCAVLNFLCQLPQVTPQPGPAGPSS